ncbi:MAG: DEAD/DEAH box helicase [Candidatus Aenigmarchaeota archaeon]|nr:DEAD/DEAH box helicase [Candidatus Aenigmarchaeota archaeon]MDI6722084.1 DEAD/DEAH box helicase [Candidatus Aenigmarchaeota archaeon]
MEFVIHPWINPGTVERRDYQESIAGTAVSGNTLVCIPTGLGKTNLAALVVARRLSKNMNGKILFLAPTRPLVEQHKKSFEKMLKVEIEKLQVVTGMNPPADRHEIYKKADIIFSTPQTIRNDLKHGIISLGDFILCIFDEAHRAVGMYAYPYVAKVYMSQSKDPLILALTASPGSEKYKIDEVRDKLYIKNIEIRTRDDMDVKKYVQSMKQDFAEVELSVPMQSIRKYLEGIKNERIKKLVEWKIIRSYNITKTEILKKQQELAKTGSGWKFAAISLLAEVLKVDHALMLLETQCIYSLKNYFDKMKEDAVEGKSKAVTKLMANESFQNAMRLTDELYKEGHEHPKIDKMKEIVVSQIEKDKFSRIIVFAQYRDTINKIFNVLTGIPKVAPVEFIGQAKKKGKGLSQKEQVQILNEFKMGFYNVLCASQVAEEGLDVAETNLVIFYEPTPSAIRKIQRSGRTARTETGRVIILITKNTRDEAYHWSAHRREKKMTKLLYQMREKTLRSFT